MQPERSPDEAEGLWLSISDLAVAKGVSRQSAHERVARLEKLGLITVRQGVGRSRLVNVAAFDRAAGETVDAVRQSNGSGAFRALTALPPGQGIGDPILAREQARRAAYDADLKQLDLEERLGKLLPVEDVREAQTQTAEAIVRVLEQLPGRAAENAAAVARDGEAGARAFLKQAVRDVRSALARSMSTLASEPPVGSDLMRADES